jgi:GAF domain-containing protein
MSTGIHITSGSKQQQYEGLIPQLEAIVGDETDPVANMANIAACLKEQFNWHWVGFYLVKSQNELVLGPFQGPVACTRIAKGKGVCGTAWAEAATLVVADVDKFPGHIACSASSKSEIVVPIFNQGRVRAVLDVDSDKTDDFDATDRQFLEIICQKLAPSFEAD